MSADEPAPTVRVIVVNYNSGNLLGRCIDALHKQTFSDFEAIIVDNNSTDGSVDAAMVDDPRFTIRRLDDNIGFAAANNLGAKDAATPWLAMLNPDAFAEPNWLAELMDATRRYPDTAMFGSTQISANDPRKLDGSGDAYFAFGLAWRGNYGHPLGDLPEDGETFSPCAAAALYKTAAFQDVGGYDERFFCYLEDVDLGFRLRHKREHCVQVKSAVVYHVGSALTGEKSDFVRFHSARNGIWLFSKNMPGVLFWLLLPGHVLLQLAWLARAALHGQIKPVWLGIRAGLGGLSEIWQERPSVRAPENIKWTSISRALCWSPWRLLNRGHDVRKYRLVRAPSETPPPTLPKSL